MSTNKTPNYQLHSWLPDDEFHLTEINENFAKLDTAVGAKASKAEVAQKAKLVVGTYTGNGGEQHIALPGKPQAVLVEAVHGGRGNGAYNYGGLVMRGTTGAGGVTVHDTGFTVNRGGVDVSPNSPNCGYIYLAIMAGE